MTKQQINTLIDLNEAAYCLSAGTPCVLPAGFSAPVPVRMDAGALPHILQGDNRPIWGFSTTLGGQDYLVIRGTQNTMEWIADAFALPMASWANGSRVHRGFKEIYDGLSIGLPKLTKPVITGHSLGAALAALIYAATPGATLVRFASPRVGNDHFSQLLAGTLRIVNRHDLVPMVPELFGFDDKDAITLEVRGPWNPFNGKIGHALESYRTGYNALL